jgi:hypothetical protein
MHNAVPKIPEETQKKIVALVMYGDPELKAGAKAKHFPPALEAKLLENCAEGDMVSLHPLSKNTRAKANLSPGLR